ncbi:Asp-tRNA(Asn)/Glu-tRNA(Gln) amidotransferase subunit GatA [[Mycoplasma] cavipharyngis]|uniref:amidase family protein n=1 Tax=[Mycoplasma] cavipharyngis TaxID=92757 RepID=UPI003704B768
MRSKIWQQHQILKQQPKQIDHFFQQIKTQLKVHQTANPVINDCLSSAANFVEQFKQPTNLLSGIFYALKDNIVTTDQVTTGGSLFLKNYQSPFNATVYDRLLAVGAINVAKTNMDEFGLGGSGTFSAYGKVHLPNKPEYLIGGSSSGSAYLVAANIVSFSIGTDTGDSIRKPASYSGIVGFKPSYGLISRYGVYPFCPSLDTVGIFSQYVLDVAIVLSTIAHKDEHDATSWNDAISDYFSYVQKPLTTKIKIGLFKLMFDYEQNSSCANSNFALTKQAFEQLVIKLTQDSNFEIVWIDFDQEFLWVIDDLYQIITYAEAASCYANLTGITFGLKQTSNNFIDSINHNRSVFGAEFKKRMAIGGYVLDQENYHNTYLQAKKVREVIANKLALVWEQCDFILSLGAFGTTYLMKDFDQQIRNPNNMIDNILQIANFFGLPSITIPWIKINQLPVGINLFGPEKTDGPLLNLAYWLETWLETNK